MKPSTLSELAGFTSLTAAAFTFGVFPGLITGGVALLLIGYALEDTQAIVAVGRIINPLRARRVMRKAKRAERRKKRAETKRSWSFRQPAEVLLRVKAD